MILPSLASPKVGKKGSPRGTWCTVDHGNNIFQAKIFHLRGGKFEILEDNMQGSYVGKIVDASQIFGCDIERSD